MKRLLVVSISLAAFALALAWWSQGYPSLASSSRVQKSPPGARKAEPRPAVIGSATSLPQAPSARALRYAIEFHNEFLPGEHEGDDPGLLLGFSALLTISPVEDGPALRWSQLVLSELTPLVDSKGRNWLEGPEKAYLEIGLSQPFYLAVKPDGRAETLKLTRPSDALIEGILRLVAESTQFAAGAEASYQTAELDPVGEALVSYRRLADQRYQKRKIKYLRLLTPEGLLTPEQGGLDIAVNAETLIVRDPTGSHALALALVEDTSTKLGDAALTNHIELELRLLGTADSSAALQAWRDDRGRPDVDLRRLPAVHEVDAERRLRELVGDKSASDLLVGARSVPADDKARRRQLLAQLEASLVLEPEGARELARSFGKADDSEASLVLSALGNAGTPGAQRALGSLAADSTIDGTRRESAFALLGMTREPTRETVELVREASRDGRHPNHRTAMLALGNLQQRLGDGEESDDVFDELAQKLQQAQSDTERTLCLSALGNTGDGRLSALVRPFVAQGAEPVRAEALWALRLVGDSEAFALLAHGASADPEPRVRQRAIEALRYRPGSDTTRVLAAAASADPEAEVRLSALVVLSSLNDPSVRDLVRAIAERDANDAVREQAARMLGQG